MINQRYTFAEDSTNTIYVCRGVDPISQRVWLCVEEVEYDGYDGDVILSPVTGMTYHVVLDDHRSLLPSTLTLCPVPQNNA